MKPRMMIVMVGPSPMGDRVAIMFAQAPDAAHICGMVHMPHKVARQWLADWVAAGKPLVTLPGAEIPESGGVVKRATKENPLAFLPEAQPERAYDTPLPLLHDDLPSDIRTALNPPLPDGSNVIPFPAHPTLN